MYHDNVYPMLGAIVSDKFNVLDLAVGMNITHPQIGALKIVLENREPCTSLALLPLLLPLLLLSLYLHKYFVSLSRTYLYIC